MVRDIARRVAESRGLELVDVTVQRSKRGAQVRVFLDREAGIGIEDLKQASEEISVILDVEDPMESAYTLEVSSPGLDRPLHKREDFERFAGRRAQLSSYEPVQGRRHWQGRLLGVEGGDVRIELDQEGSALASVPLDKVAHARLVVEFPASPKMRGTK